VPSEALGVTVDYAALIKKLKLPPDFTAPIELTYEDVTAQALTRGHLADDVRGINVSLELIRRTRGGEWPSEPVDLDGNYMDLVWHELEFREGTSFAYPLYGPESRYLGCCYLYPVGQRTPLSEDLLARDVDVSWWVTPDAYEQGYYATVHRALQHWVTEDFPFTNPHWSNAEIPAGGTGAATERR
jgi:hypothetical protein